VLSDEHWWVVRFAQDSELSTQHLIFRFEVVEHRLIAEAIAVGSNWDEEEIDGAHSFSGQRVGALRQEGLAGSLEENREPLHSILIARVLHVAFHFDQLQIDRRFRVEIDTKACVYVFGKFFFCQTSGH